MESAGPGVANSPRGARAHRCGVAPNRDSVKTASFGNVLRSWRVTASIWSDARGVSRQQDRRWILRWWEDLPITTCGNRQPGVLHARRKLANRQTVGIPYCSASSEGVKIIRCMFQSAEDFAAMGFGIRAKGSGCSTRQTVSNSE